MSLYHVEIAPTRGLFPIEAESARDAVRQSVTSSRTFDVRVVGPEIVTRWRASRYVQELVSWYEPTIKIV